MKFTWCIYFFRYVRPQPFGRIDFLKNLTWPHPLLGLWF